MSPKIIADVSSNHMGDMRIARSMIKSAAAVGVDVVKFQSWRAENLRKDFPGYEDTLKRYRQTQLSDDDHYRLIDWCNEFGVEFLTTCFDLNRVEFLASLGLKTIKVASSDCTSFSLLKKLMDHFEQLIISTGMTTDREIEQMVKVVAGHKVTLMHCVSIYPCPLDKVNLERIDWLRTFGFPVGFSDHSLGTEASQAALTLGVEIIEKHFTLSRYLPGKDQEMSTTPEELAEIVSWAKKIKAMRGRAGYELTEDQRRMRDIYIGKWGNNR